MTNQQILITGYRKLQTAEIKSAHLDAEILLAHILKKPREYLLSHPEHKLAKKQEEKYKKIINQRAKNAPVAYLTNEKEFYGRKFYVDKRVLVPRPETEMIIDEAKRIMQSAKNKIHIIDIGAGSGCITITLAKEMHKYKKIKYFAVDISKKALTLARKNAHLHNMADKIKFLRGNLLEPFLKNKKIEIENSSLIICANLPYLTPAQIKNSPSIKHEPRLALNGGRDGLKYYRRLNEQIKRLQSRQPNLNLTLICEIDENQAKKMQKIFSFAESIKIKKDLNGLDRIMIIKYKILKY